MDVKLVYRLAYRLRRSDSDEEDEADEVVPELVAAEDDDEPGCSDVSLRDTEPPHTKPRADETESSRYP